MPTAHQLRTQIEATLATRIPSALTPLPRVTYPVAPTGIDEIDRLLHGGFPVGAISELVGPECSGRTSLALTFVASMTQAGKVCAWVDVSDTLQPESAAAIGVDLSRLLWIRCGRATPPAGLPLVSARGLRIAEKPPRTKPGLPTGGGGHPRMEVQGLSAAVSELLGTGHTTDRVSGALPKQRPQGRLATNEPQPATMSSNGMPTTRRNKSWSRLEQALRVTDLLLQAGGFCCIVLDMGSLQPEYALRVPLATWFRFRAAAERLQSNVVLLTQHTCCRNSAGIVLQLERDKVLKADSPIFTGFAYRAELTRQRFPQSPGNVLPMRKPPQGVHTTQWQGRAVWAGRK